MRKIFLDLDGVMADFEGKCKQTFGKSPSQFKDQTEFWSMVCKQPHFWLDLKLMKGCITMLHQLEQIPDVKIEILTALPRPTGYCSTCRDDKVEWVHKNLGEKYIVNTVIGGTNKARFIDSPDDILIDDTQKNITEWNRKGGIGILHDPTNVHSTVLRVLSIVNK